MATFRSFGHPASWRFVVTLMKDGQGDGASLLSVIPDPTKRTLVQSQPPSVTGPYHRTPPARGRARGTRHIRNWVSTSKSRHSSVTASNLFIRFPFPQLLELLAQIHTTDHANCASAPAPSLASYLIELPAMAPLRPRIRIVDDASNNDMRV